MKSLLLIKGEINIRFVQEAIVLYQCQLSDSDKHALVPKDNSSFGVKYADVFGIKGHLVHKDYKPFIRVHMYVFYSLV